MVPTLNAHQDNVKKGFVSANKQVKLVHLTTIVMSVYIAHQDIVKPKSNFKVHVWMIILAPIIVFVI